MRLFSGFLLAATISSYASVLSAAEETWSFTNVCKLAAARAAAPYVDSATSIPTNLAYLNYDSLNCIEFDQRKAIWGSLNLPFRLMMYHLGGNLHQRGVALNLVEDGRASRIPFDPRLYLYHQIPIDTSELPRDLDFAGFRALGDLSRSGRVDEVISFLGASYFRALGKGHAYGTSARGLAVNPAFGEEEEFPRFVGFWVVRPETGVNRLGLYALLDSPSVAGAYAFEVHPGEDTIVRVHAVLYARRPMTRYGLGTLTSMFWYGENSTARFGDFRPEVHDADGLLVERSDGAWIWRPLVNPSERDEALVPDVQPRGFGLLQRDRHFLNYQDIEGHYERRPSVWVEPLGDWGRGSVRLAELPTCNEYGDNIVAYWQPAAPLQPGSPFEASWSLHWCTENAAWPAQSRCINTFVCGQRIMIDFAGCLPGGDPTAVPTADVQTDNGMIEGLHFVRNAETGGWRVGFAVNRAEKRRPANLQAFLRDGAGRTMSEIWTYRLTP